MSPIFGGGFGHPPGLYTLFFTEMWERLSYYGMRALLVLFMVDQIERGGMGLTKETASAIYGLYTALVYVVALPGGWVADRLLGAQRSVWYGGWLIAAGHFTLAVPTTEAFFLGLVLIVVGTGLLKPNISVIVGQLYPEGGARRDAGFTIFYMGINLGAMIGPLVCSTLGEKINWHWGFGAAGVGMLAGARPVPLWYEEARRRRHAEDRRGARGCWRPAPATSKPDPRRGGRRGLRSFRLTSFVRQRGRCPGRWRRSLTGSRLRRSIALSILYFVYGSSATAVRKSFSAFSRRPSLRFARPSSRQARLCLESRETAFCASPRAPS